MWNKTFLTNHAIERFFERFPNLSVAKGLQIENAKSDSRKTAVWKTAIMPLLSKATENRSLLNDTNFMLNFYEKYGFDNRLSFFDNPQAAIRFVLSQKEDGSMVVVTVVNLRVREKFKPKKPQTRVKNIHRFVQNPTMQKQITIAVKMSELGLSKPEDVKDVAVILTGDAPKIKQKQVKSIEEKLLTSRLIWENLGNMRDDNGYLLTDVEKINLAGVKIQITIESLKKALLEKMNKSDANIKNLGEDKYFHFKEQVGNLIVEFKSTKVRCKGIGLIHLERIFKLD